MACACCPGRKALQRTSLLESREVSDWPPASALSMILCLPEEGNDAPRNKSIRSAFELLQQSIFRQGRGAETRLKILGRLLQEELVVLRWAEALQGARVACPPIAHDFLKRDLLHRNLREYTVTRCKPNCRHACDESKGESGVRPREENYQKRDQANVPSRRHAAEGRGLVPPQAGIDGGPTPLKLSDCSNRMSAQSPKVCPVLGCVACCKSEVAVQHRSLLGRHGRPQPGGSLLEMLIDR